MMLINCLDPLSTLQRVAHLDGQDMKALRESNRQLSEALAYALECLTRPDEVDVIYRMEAVQKIRAAIRKGDQ